MHHITTISLPVNPNELWIPAAFNSITPTTEIHVIICESTPEVIQEVEDWLSLFDEPVEQVTVKVPDTVLQDISIQKYPTDTLLSHSVAHSGNTHSIAVRHPVDTTSQPVSQEVPATPLVLHPSHVRDRTPNTAGLCPAQA